MLDRDRVTEEIQRTQGKLSAAFERASEAERALLELDFAPTGNELAAVEADPRRAEWLRSFGDKPPGDRREDLQTAADLAALVADRLGRRLAALEVMEAELS